MFTAEDWSITKLESFLRFIFRQTETKLDLFFVCDALDEYDGKPEFVCNILKDFLEAAANSPNRLKILFSSRSWDVFKRNFGNVQSLQLQDYTKNDIRQYCLGLVESQEEDISIALDPLTPVVIKRANGVFLWVKLVLQELISEATKGKSPDELSRILSAIPDNLRDYYLRTIERTPERFRMEAYVIFQTLIIDRDLDERWSLWDLIGIIACSQAPTYHEARMRFKAPLRYPPFSNWKESGLVKQSSYSQKLDKVLSKVVKSLTFVGKSKASADVKQQRSLIMTITGGLIEFINIDDKRNKHGNVAQLAHQTVREFVSGHDFKRCILGHQAKTIFENGHTFCARYLLVRKELPTAALSLVLNERTTGRSLKRFMDTMPDDILRSRLKYWYLNRETDASHVTGPLAFAMLNGLQLYLEEALRQRPGIFRETAEKLLSILPHRQKVFSISSPGISPVINPYPPFEIHLVLTQYILNNGYTVEQDPKALHKLLLNIVADSIYNYQLSPDELGFLEAKATILTRSGLPASTLIEVPHSRKRGALNCVQALHIAKTNDFIKFLIERGIDINTPDRKGNTPLDHALGYWNKGPARPIGALCLLNDKTIHGAL